MLHVLHIDDGGVDHTAIDEINALGFSIDYPTTSAAAPSTLTGRHPSFLSLIDGQARKMDPIPDCSATSFSILPAPFASPPPVYQQYDFSAASHSLPLPIGLALDQQPCPYPSENSGGRRSSMSMLKHGMDASPAFVGSSNQFQWNDDLVNSTLGATNQISPGAGFPSLYSSSAPASAPSLLRRNSIVGLPSSLIMSSLHFGDYGANASTPTSGPPSTAGSSSDSAFGSSSRRSSVSDVLPVRVGVTPFVSKLYYALSNASFNDVMRWSRNGESWLVDIGNPRLVSDILPYLFGHSSLAAFTRQINLYSFSHLSISDLLAIVQQLDPADRANRDWRGYRHAHFTAAKEAGSNDVLHLMKPKPSLARRRRRAGLEDRNDLSGRGNSSFSSSSSDNDTSEPAPNLGAEVQHEVIRDGRKRSNGLTGRSVGKERKKLPFA